MSDEKQLRQEVEYRAVRSSGAGGQNVNKVSSKVELHFFIAASSALTLSQKELLEKNLQTRLTKSGELILQCDESRSQHKNKEIVTQRFLELVKNGLKKQKPRKKKRLPKAAKLKRLREKKIQSKKKSSRKDPLKE